MTNAILTTRHPLYQKNQHLWQQWREVYEAGQWFIDKYLTKLSNLESDADFNDRKTRAYAPAFATSLIDEVKNSIFQRIADVQRVGGTDEFQRVINGENGGVDYQSSSMGVYIGQQIILELLLMGQVECWLTTLRT